MATFTKQFALLRETAAMAFDTLRGNKMRSALTVLGVVIGVTSIVGMTSLIRGFDTSLRNSINSLGPEHDLRRSGSARLSFSSGASFLELMRRPELTVDDMRGDRAAGDRRSAWSTSGSAPAPPQPTHGAHVLPRRAHPARCRSWAPPSASSTSTSPRCWPAASFTEQEVQRARAASR